MLLLRVEGTPRICATNSTSQELDCPLLSWDRLPACSRARASPSPHGTTRHRGVATGYRCVWISARGAALGGHVAPGRNPPGHGGFGRAVPPRGTASTSCCASAPCSTTLEPAGSRRSRAGVFPLALSVNCGGTLRCGQGPGATGRGGASLTRERVRGVFELRDQAGERQSRRAQWRRSPVSDGG